MPHDMIGGTGGPTPTFECADCGFETGVDQRPTECPECGGEMVSLAGSSG